MYRPVFLTIWIISYIAGSIRKPVTAHFLTCQLLNQGNDLRINYVMHISCNGNSCTSCKSSCKRKSFYYFFAFLQSLHTVWHHLVNKRKWHCKSQSGYKGTHKIVSQFHLCMGKLGKKNSKILTAIIIINMSFWIPQISCRKCGASHHSFHKTIIHELLGSICSRAESCQICPHKKCKEKQ